MQALLLRCREEESDFLLAHLYELGTAGVTERDLPGQLRELEAFFDTKVDAAGLERFDPRWREYPETRADWDDTFEPLAVGRGLYLVPSWRDDPVPPGRIRLTVHARQASGSGYQPATQLALEALERHLPRGARVLDVGTGSGILCSAACLLGAGPCFACDVDPSALAEARENGTPASLFAGSARSVAAASADLVVANLNAEALLMLRTDLMRVLRPEPAARLILSGFTRRNLERLAAAFSPPLVRIETLVSGQWHALVFAPPESPAR